MRKRKDAALTKRTFNMSSKRTRRLAQKFIPEAGLEKFRIYAEPRGIYLDTATYGKYKVVKKSRISQREAVRAAIEQDDNEFFLGWVINMPNGHVRFIADGEGFKLFPLDKRPCKRGIFVGPSYQIKVRNFFVPAT